MTHEELTNFDMRAGAEKRKKNSDFIKKSDKASYVIMFKNLKDKNIYYYIGKEYFADQFSGLHISEEKNIVYDWRCFKKHFIEGSYLRNFIEKVIKNDKDWQYLLIYPYASFSKYPVIIKEDDVINILKERNIEYNKLTELLYTQEIIFDFRNSDIDFYII